MSHENQTKKQSIHKTDEIKCSNRYETLYTDDDDESCNSYDSSTSSDGSILSDEIYDEISSDNMQKKKKSKNLNGKEANEKEGQKECLKKRMKLLKKERVIYV